MNEYSTQNPLKDEVKRNTEIERLVQSDIGKLYSNKLKFGDNPLTIGYREKFMSI